MSAHSSSLRSVDSTSEAELRRRIERVFAHRYVQEQLARWRRGAPRTGTDIYKPRMDLYDDPDDAFITAVLELPGVATEDLRLRIENNFLLIEGQRRDPTAAHSANTQNAEEGSGDSAVQRKENLADSTVSRGTKVRELRYGQFRRAIELPRGVQASDVHTSLGLGMLTLSWPRNPPGATHAETMAVDEDARTRADSLGRRVSRSASAP